MRVQGGEHEVAGLGGVRAAGIVSRSRISPTRITSGSSRRAAERLGEVVGVGADLALVDEALLVAVEVLDRVLDREDVLLALSLMGRSSRRAWSTYPSRSGR